MNIFVVIPPGPIGLDIRHYFVDNLNQPFFSNSRPSSQASSQKFQQKRCLMGSPCLKLLYQFHPSRFKLEVTVPLAVSTYLSISSPLSGSGICMGRYINKSQWFSSHRRRGHVSCTWCTRWHSQSHQVPPRGQIVRWRSYRLMMSNTRASLVNYWSWMSYKWLSLI